MVILHAVSSMHTMSVNTRKLIFIIGAIHVGLSTFMSKTISMLYSPPLHAILRTAPCEESRNHAVGSVFLNTQRD